MTDKSEAEMLEHELDNFRLTLNRYQKLTEATAHYGPHQQPVVYPALGLGGEAGEVLDKIKKVLRGDGAMFDDPDFRDAIKLELGDVLWYLAAIARDVGLTLEEVATANIRKTYDRQARGVTRGEGDNR